MSTTPQGPQTPAGAAPAQAPQQSSGSKVLLWVLGGIGAFLLLCFVSCAAIGFFVMHKARQAGLDPELMKKNPALAAAKMTVFANPDVELVSSNDSAGTMVVRDKKTGRVTKLRFDAEKKSMIVTDENGKTASITADGNSLEFKGPDGSMKVGASADKPPDWVPVYPGSTPQATFSATSEGKQAGNYVFTTSDDVSKVLDFYGDKLKSQGFETTTTTGSQDGKSMGTVSGTDKASSRSVTVIVGTDEKGTAVTVTFGEKADGAQ